MFGLLFLATFFALTFVGVPAVLFLVAPQRARLLGRKKQNIYLLPSGEWKQLSSTELGGLVFTCEESCHGAPFTDRLCVRQSTLNNEVMLRPSDHIEDTSLLTGDQLFDNACTVQGDPICAMGLLDPSTRTLLDKELKGVQLKGQDLILPRRWSGPEDPITEIVQGFMSRVSEVTEAPDDALIKRLSAEHSSAIRQLILKTVQQHARGTSLHTKVLTHALSDPDVWIRSYASSVCDHPKASEVALACLRSKELPAKAKLIHMPWSLSGMDNDGREAALLALMNCGAIPTPQRGSKRTSESAIAQYFGLLDQLPDHPSLENTAPNWIEAHDRLLGPAIHALYHSRRSSAQGQLALTNSAPEGELSLASPEGALSPVRTSDD